jgi:hypothetical protein
MKREPGHKISSVLIIALTLTIMSRLFSTVEARPNSIIQNRTLTANRAIASWPSGIPAGETRPVIVFLPGWGGNGAVNASISAQNTNLANQGYVTLAIGFDSSSTWNSDIQVKALQGLNKLCTLPANSDIPANCDAIVLDGASYGGAQNYWVIEYLRNNGYDGAAGSKGNAIGFISEDAGYGAPGVLTNATTGAYTRTGLADTSAYSVAMIENQGDTTFPINECTWGNCGIKVLSNAHLAQGDTNAFSMCPPGGSHGNHTGYSNWNTWVISAIKTIIHIENNIPEFSGYTDPALSVANSCVDASVLPGLTVSGINITANGQPIRLRGMNMGDPFWARNPDWYPNYTTADYAAIAEDWNANVVRISIFPTQWKNMNRATLLAGLAQEINAALDNGMYVIISYHVIGWPDGWYQAAYPGNPADTYDSSMTVARSFWAKMAQTYGSDTRIIFDLWNEPVHASSGWEVADPNPHWPALKLAYEDLIQTVRNNGAQNIVLATGNRWASWLVGIKENPLTDPKVVYAYHKYSVEGSNTAAEWNKDTGGLIGVKPVLVSEWGYEDTDIANPTWPGSQASYGDAFVTWMEANRLGSLAWMYHHEWNPSLIKSDETPTIYGAFVKNYLNAPIVNLNKPDLIVTNVTLNPPMPKTYETFEVSITIRNQGYAGDAAVVYRDVYIDRNPSVGANPITGCTSSGDFFRSDSYTSLDAGMTDTQTVTVPGGLPPGNHQIWVYVDSRCLVEESGESNNNP